MFNRIAMVLVVALVSVAFTTGCGSGSELSPAYRTELEAAHRGNALEAKGEILGVVVNEVLMGDDTMLVEWCLGWGYDSLPFTFIEKLGAHVVPIRIQTETWVDWMARDTVECKRVRDRILEK
jgi:hypothetical protein